MRIEEPLQGLDNRLLLVGNPTFGNQTIQTIRKYVRTFDVECFHATIVGRDGTFCQLQAKTGQAENGAMSPQSRKSSGTPSVTRNVPL